MAAQARGVRRPVEKLARGGGDIGGEIMVGRQTSRGTSRGHVQEHALGIPASRPLAMSRAVS